MDIKSKSSSDKPRNVKGFFVWLGLVAGLSMLFAMSAVIIQNTTNFYSALKDSFKRDYYSTDKYAESVISLIQDAVDEIAFKKENNDFVNKIEALSDDTKFTYYYKDEYTESGRINSFITTVGEETDQYASLICVSNGNLFLSNGSLSHIGISNKYYLDRYKEVAVEETTDGPTVSYQVLPDGSEITTDIDSAPYTLVPSDTPAPVDREDMIGHESYFMLIAPDDAEQFASMQKYLQQYNDFTLYIAIKESAIFLPPLYNNYSRWGSNMLWCYILVACVIVDFILILQGLLLRKYRKQFVGSLMKLTGWFLLEIKLAVAIMTAVLLVLALESVGSNLGLIIIVLLTFWILWYLMLDLYYNGKRTLKNNIPYHILSAYRRYENKKPFYKALMIRTIGFVACELVLVVLFFSFILGSMWFVPILIVIFGIALAFLYIRKSSELYTDMDLVNQKLTAIRNGEEGIHLNIPVNHDLYNTVTDLNNVQEGIRRAVNEMMRSERLKVDLITNVSHDLKTPLTSIISYIELLSSEKLQPEKANEYVNIIKTKASHLDRLTNDLVEISKAQSGNIKMVMEKIDITSHIRQTLAELSERIDASGLDFKVSLPEKPAYINADGGKLYRVYENLIINAIKYSMPGTRVYLIVAERGGKVYFEIKNIASYEMSFSVEDITERFTRGDNSRTTEGSGLGLSIAKTYVELCGGKLNVTTDGDLFKVMIEFASCGKTEEIIEEIEEAVLRANDAAEDSSIQTA